jgi:hypothetical protein
VSPSQKILAGIYCVAVLALIVVGGILWATGHGTGDPYLTLGIALALAPIVAIWLLRRFRRD